MRILVPQKIPVYSGLETLLGWWLHMQHMQRSGLSSSRLASFFFGQTTGNKRRIAAATTLTAALLLSGCQMQPTATADDSPVPVAIEGTVHGGQQPITFSTIKVYETKPNGVATNGVYVGTATVLGTTTTDGGGHFSFNNGSGAPTLACSSASDYLYVTSAGGTPMGQSSANSNILLMAAIGSCSNIGNVIVINEATTIAAAYALAPFMSLSGTTVNITSSATNYATVSTTPGSQSAAGLAHAFLNAANLVNPLNAYYGANTNITTLGTNQATIVPTAVPATQINTLANSMQMCVNSTGGSASSAATALAFTAPTTATSSAGATSTLTPTSSTTSIDGTIGLALGGGTATTIIIPAGTVIAGVASAINANTVYSGEGLTAAVASGVLTLTGPNTSTQAINFSSITAPTASVGGTATVYNVLTASGNVSISIGGGTALTGTVSATSVATFVTSFNANSSFSGAGLTAAASSSGYNVIITGPSGVSNTLNFAGSAVTGTVGTTLAITGSLYQDGGDGSACGEFFADTTPTGGTPATNTLAAVLSLARKPYPSAGGVFGLWNLAPTNGAFGTTLTAAPKDWTISIYYFIGAGGTGQPAASYPYYGTLDASDNFYLLDSSASTPAAGTNTALYSFSSNGTLNYANLTGLGITYPAAYTLTPDQYGNLWANQNSTAIIQLKASDGTFVTSYTGSVNSVKGIAADPLGNIWLGRSQITTDVLGELIYAGTGTTNGSGASVYPLQSTVYAELYPTGTGSGTITGLNYGKGPAWGPYGMTFDAGLNLWYAGYYSAGTGIVVLPNSNGTTAYTFSTPTAPTATVGAVSTLTYSNLVAVNGSLSISIAGGTAITGTITGTTGPSAFATAFNNLSQFTTAGLNATATGGTLSIVGPVGTTNTLSFTGTSVSAAAPSYTFTPAATNSSYISASLTAGTTPYGVAIDAHGDLWSLGSVTPTLNKFVVTRTGSVPTGTVTAVAAGVAVTNNSSAGFSGPHFIEMDGGGNIWIADDASGHGVEVYPTGVTNSTATGSTSASFLSESAGYSPCVIVSNACVANTSTTGAAPARSVSVDSAGSVWIVGGTSITISMTNPYQVGTVVQMFGGASPTWWQGAAKPGVMP
jgi:hypothetical protein